MMSLRSYPPLSCRTSPPQGGRLAGRATFIQKLILDTRDRAAEVEQPGCRESISPLEGEMSGRTEGGDAPAQFYLETEQ
jgi:hypothetical protein